MSDNLKIVRGVILGFAAIFVLLFIFSALGLFQIKFWGVKYDDAQRERFEHTQSYVQGMESQLSALRLEYESQEEGPRKEAIRRHILTKASQIDRDKLPADLVAFLNRLENR